MTNYEELVEALLSASTVSTAWEKLMLDAAAAIEDMAKHITEMHERVTVLQIDRGHLETEVKEWRRLNNENLLPKRGEWVIDGTFTYNIENGCKAYEPVYRCSCCNRQMESYLRLDEPNMPEDADFPEFCPHCGAKMEANNG